MKVCNAYVLPILTYNCGTWGFSDIHMKRLNAHHRRHLRKILGIRWPDKISNSALYDKLGTFDIESFVKKMRLKLFGHVLRLPTKTPAQKAMNHYFKPGKRDRGRPKHLLPTRLVKDLKDVNKQFKTKSDLIALRNLASDRKAWNQTFGLKN